MFLAGGKVVGCLVHYQPEQVNEPKAPDFFLWSLPLGKLLGVIPEVFSVASSSDGSRLATGHKGGMIRIWNPNNLQNKNELNILKSADPPVALAFSRHGLTLASVTQKGPVCLWDVRRLKLSRALPRDLGDPLNLTFAPTGNQLCLVMRSKILFWDTTSGKPSPTLAVGDPESIGAAFCTNFESVALVGADNSVAVYSMKGKGGSIEMHRPPPGIRQVQFTPSGQLLIVRGLWLGLWDTKTGNRIHLAEGHRSTIMRITFAPDSKTLGSLDDLGEMRLWALPSGKPLKPFAGEEPIRTIRARFEPDGKGLCVIGVDGRATTWVLPSGQVHRRSLPVVSRKLLQSWAGRRNYDEGYLSTLDASTYLLLAPGNKRAAVVQPDHSVEVVDLQTGKTFRFLRHEEATFPQLTFSPNGEILAAFGVGEIVRLWDMRTGKQVGLFRAKGRCEACAFSPDGSVFAWTDGAAVHLFDTKRKQYGNSLPDPATDVSALTFDASGRYLAVTCDEGITLLWDTESQVLVRRGISNTKWPQTRAVPLPGEGFVTFPLFLDANKTIPLRDQATGFGLASFSPGQIPVAVTPDGRVVATGGGHLSLWERYTGQEVCQLPRFHRGLISSLAFSPDGIWLATGGTDTSIVLWDWRRQCGWRKDLKRSLSEGDLARCWQGLASEDPRAAYSSMARLLTAPEKTMRFLNRYLSPVRPIELQVVRKWVADLDSDDFTVRMSAVAGLKDFRAEWTPFLHEALRKKPSVEARSHLEKILSGAGTIFWSAGMLRRLRAVQVLEEIGTPEAQHLLTQLSKGVPQAFLTAEANRSLRRLRQSSTKSKVQSP
jgi:WD40 repeat protein